MYHSSQPECAPLRGRHVLGNGTLLCVYFTSGRPVLASQPNIPVADMANDTCASLQKGDLD